MRASLAVLALIALTVGCGSDKSTAKRGAPTPGSLEALWRNSGESVALIPGTSDYSPGELRVSFLVVNRRGRVIAPKRAQVWASRSLAAKPFARATARLEPIGVPGVSSGADAAAIYVTHLRVPGSREVLRPRATGRPSPYRRARPAPRAEAVGVSGRGLACLSVANTDAGQHRRTSRSAHDAGASRSCAFAHLGRIGPRGAPSVRRHLRHATLLLESHMRTGRRRDRPRSQAIHRNAHSLHPRRGLQGQRSEEGTERVGARMEPAGRALDVSRRTRRQDQGEVPGVSVVARTARRNRAIPAVV